MEQNPQEKSFTINELIEIERDFFNQLTENSEWNTDIGCYVSKDGFAFTFDCYPNIDFMETFFNFLKTKK